MTSLQVMIWPFEVTWCHRLRDRRIHLPRIPYSRTKLEVNPMLGCWDIRLSAWRCEKMDAVPKNLSEANGCNSWRVTSQKGKQTSTTVVTARPQKKGRQKYTRKEDIEKNCGKQVSNKPTAGGKWRRRQHKQNGVERKTWSVTTFH